MTITTDSGGTDGTIDISGNVDGTTGSHQNLIIDSGTANVTIGSGTGTQVIGSTVAKALNKIEINKTDGAGAETGTITIDDIGTATTYGAGTNGTTTDAVYIGNAHTTAVVLKGTEYNFNNSVYIQAKANGSNDDIQIDGASPTFQATNDTITFETGVINLASGLTTIQSNNGPITLTAVYGQGDEDLTVDAGTADGSATVSVGIIGHGTGTSTSEISKVTLDGPDGVTLSGNITTGDYSDAAVDITGPVTLGAGITIDTAETNNDGTITFNSTATINGANTLTLNTDTGAVALQGAIGTSGTGIGNLDINQSGGNATIEVNDIGDADNVGVTGTVNIGNAATTSITLDGTVYKFDGNVEFDAAAGATIKFTGVSPELTTEAEHTLAFTTGDVELSGTTGTPSVGTTTFTAPGGVTFAGDIIGKAGMSG